MQGAHINKVFVNWVHSDEVRQALVQCVADHRSLVMGNETGFGIIVECTHSRFNIYIYVYNHLENIK